MSLSASDWIALAALIAGFVVPGVVAVGHFAIRQSKSITKLEAAIEMQTICFDHLRESIESLDGSLCRSVDRIDQSLAEERSRRRAEITDLRAELRAVPTLTPIPRPGESQ